MMKIYRLFLPCIVYLMLFPGCSDTTDPSPDPDPTPGNPPPTGAGMAHTEEVSIILPEGVNLDMSKAVLSTGMMTFPVTQAGKSRAVLPPGTTRLAYLFDESSNLILMGVLHQTNKTINAETTAQALFYLGSGIFYHPEEVVSEFLVTPMELPGYVEFKDKVAAALKTDIFYLEKLRFEQDLKVLLEEYRKEGEVLDIRARQINVDPTGFQSGVQVFENDAQTIKIANTYRRRAHAFIYKTAFVAKGSKEETVLLPTVPFSEKTTLTKEVGPTNAFSSTLGTIVDQIMGKGIEYARVETDPVNLPLADSEDRATYQVRVVGTSLNPASSPAMTEEEFKTWEKLMAKQLFLDFVLPILSEMWSEIKGAQDGNFGIEAFEYFLSQSPAIWDLVEKGDFKKATEETIKYLVVDKGGQALQEQLIKLVVDKYKNLDSPTWIDLDREYNNSMAVGRYVKLIKAVELTVKLLDMGKLTAEIAMASRINVFTAQSIRSEVNITPKNETTVPFANVALKAETKTELTQGQSFVYKWSTTGKYGVIAGAGGVKGVSIETSSPSVNFRSEVNSAQLEENNLETVKVEVYIKEGTSETFVGDGSATVNVKKVKLVMRPDDILLDGRKKQQVRLYLERTDYVNDIVSTAALEYKVEWATAGAYGLFDGVNRTATTRGNSINYQALDDKVKEGIETITARVYFRTPGSDWVLREEVKGTVKVDNDPRKIILDVPLVTKEWVYSESGYSAGVNCLVPVPVTENAVKYTVKLYGFKIPAGWWENATASWPAGGSPPSVYSFPGAGPNEVVGDTYYYTVGRTWCAGSPPYCGQDIPIWHATYAAYGGRANVVIELKD